MKDIRVFIVEDEKKSLEMMMSLIELFFSNLTVVGSAPNIKVALTEIPKHEIDILFLDINLPDGNGFNLLNHLDKLNFEIVFTTAYEEFAIKAIRYSALDYLLKPIDVDELELAINRYRLKGKKQVGEQQIREFSKDISENGRPSQIGLPSKNGIQFIPYNDIVRCEADSSYTVVYTIKKQIITVSKNLKQIQETLSDNRFIRCHRKYLVNKNFIKEYIRGNGGQVIMKDGSFALVSKRMKSDFLKILREN